MTQRQSDDLFVSLYDELHRLAEVQIRRAGGDLSLGATTLLHEAYLSFAAKDTVQFPDQSRFLGYAARAMRSIVIDYARRGLAQKRGGGAVELTLTQALVAQPTPAHGVAELESLSTALDELASVDASLAELVDLHFFCGYSFVEIANIRGVSERTVQRDWRKARLLLQHTIENASNSWA